MTRFYLRKRKVMMAGSDEARLEVRSSATGRKTADVRFRQQRFAARMVKSSHGLQHLSERYETRRKEIQLSFLEPASDYYQLPEAEQPHVLEDELEYQVKNVYKLPREATWTYLRENAHQDDIKVKVDQAFVDIDELLAARNPDYKGVLEPVFVRSQLSPTQVAGLINLFSQAKFSEENNPQSDIYGRVYEYYIGKFAQAEGSGAGQFFTPGSVVRLLVEMTEPLRGRIMDLACGSGGMFVQSLKFVQAHGGDRNDISLYGQERYEGTLRLCKMNLLLRNLNFDVKLGDSLLHDRFPHLKADYALMNPPFNISNWHPELLPDKDPRLFGPASAFTTPGNANYMWFQTLWHHLSERGTAGVVMSNGAMATGSQGEANVREHMIRQGMVDCIVQLPDKLFLTTGIPACLFILSRNRDGRDGEHRERLREILFIDARKLGHLVTRRLRAFSDADIARIADTYHQWRNLHGSYANTEGFCKAATLAEVEASNFVLSPGRYVGSEAEETDGVPFEEKMQQLTAQLAAQFEESAVLEKKIRTHSFL